MNRSSLLDYIDDKDRAEDIAEPEVAARLELRLADLERRLAATRGSAQVVQPPESALTLSAQIESILHRQPSPQLARRAEPSAPPLILTPLAKVAPAQPVPRDPSPDERSEEFAKFVEAVHLIGQAAKRFLREPAKAAGPSEDVQHLTASLRDTVAAFQTMTADLASAAAEIRGALHVSKSSPAPAPLPLAPREDTELLRLQADLDALRERLASLARRRT